MASTIPEPTIDVAACGLTVEDMGNLRHMVGVGRHIRRGAWGFRNYFAASIRDVGSMQRLVAAGFACGGRAFGDGGRYYHATADGCAAIGMGKAATRRACGGRR